MAAIRLFIKKGDIHAECYFISEANKTRFPGEVPFYGFHRSLERSKRNPAQNGASEQWDLKSAFNNNASE